MFEIKQYESYAERNKQISCLQKNVYFEAAVESTAGKFGGCTCDSITELKTNTFPIIFAM